MKGAPTFDATMTEIFGMRAFERNPSGRGLQPTSPRRGCYHYKPPPAEHSSTRIARQIDEGSRAARRQTREAQLAEPRSAGRAQPAVPDPLHKFDLQHALRALLLLEAAQPAR